MKKSNVKFQFVIDYNGITIATQDQDITYPWFVEANRPFVHTVTIDGVEQKRWCKIGLVEYFPKVLKMVIHVIVGELYVTEKDALEALKGNVY